MAAAEHRTVAFDPALLAEIERRGADLAEAVDVALRSLLDGGVVDAGLDVAALEDHSSAYLQALLDRDASRARAIARAAVGAYPIADVYAEVLTPALAQIGHLWAMEEINVAQEHFATSVTQTLLGALAPGSRRTPDLGRLAVVTGTPDELHMLGTLMVADLLDREGWEVLSLGAATPAEDLVALVEQECPDLVALSIATVGRLPGVADVLRRLSAVDPRPYVMVGGAAHEAARGLGADLVVSDLRELVPALRERF